MQISFINQFTKTMKKICTTKYGEIYLIQKDNKPAILKIDYDDENIRLVNKFDSYFDHELLCKIYKVDLCNNSIIMEYLEGVSLNEIESFEERIYRSSAFFQKWIPTLYRIKRPDSFKLINYSDKFVSIIERCDDTRIKEYQLEEIINQYLIEIKKQFCGDLYLLHGDVHRRNMICVDDNQIKLIDLSPVLGPVMYEYVKFFEEELYGILAESEFEYRYTFMTRAFKLESKDFLPLLFLDSCYRMFDTLFVDNDDSELSLMMQLNYRLWRLMNNGLEI
jgi:hypothetical protein